MSRRGYRTMFTKHLLVGVSHCPVDEAAECTHVHSAGPGLWLQTGPCMPYGLLLRVATR